MNELNQIQMHRQIGNYIAQFFYKVPKKYHNEMVQINKESFDLFMEHGALGYDVFQLSDDKTLEGEGNEGFTNIATLLSASQDEEIWLEVHSYRDAEHAKEFMVKCEKDERMQPLYKRFIETIIPGSKITIGDFKHITF